MRFDILTLFPEMFASYLGESVLNKAIERGLIEVHLHNIRDWTNDRHHSVDDRPYGGGAGMVLMANIVVEAVEAVRAKTDDPGHLVMMTPQGRRYGQATVEQFAAENKRIVLLCGRYEGFDERIRLILKPDEVSIGDFVLNGGEVAAMAIVDSVIRLVPDVLGEAASHQEDSFSGPERQLEYPQYTRPREYRGLQVPPVLLSGNHQEVDRWRKQQSLLRTRQRRADLLDENTDS
jgi:tRNA (guanine37-N1)-methyltransferase